MLKVGELVEGVTKVRILNLPRGVEQVLGDVGVFEGNDGSQYLPLEVNFGGRYWFFEPEDLEIVKDESNDESVPKEIPNVSSQSEDLIIYKSRWDEIIASLESGNNSAVVLTEEEVEIVQSVLKNNLPFNVVEDPVIVDPVISKEEQTHLDATHIGNVGNVHLYYRSDILKKWFCWEYFNSFWEECDFAYDDISQPLPITISKSI